MRILTETITLEQLQAVAEAGFGNMVKAVVDVDREIIAIDSDLHSDLEAFCLEDGSEQRSLWGVNYYPEIEGDDFLEFDSMINMRPSQGNNSRGVDDKKIRGKIAAISDKWIERD